MSTSHWSGRWRGLLGRSFEVIPGAALARQATATRPPSAVVSSPRDERPAEQFVAVVLFEPDQSRPVVGRQVQTGIPRSRSSRRPGCSDLQIWHRRRRRRVLARRPRPRDRRRPREPPFAPRSAIGCRARKTRCQTWPPGRSTARPSLSKTTCEVTYSARNGAVAGNLTSGKKETISARLAWMYRSPALRSKISCSTATGSSSGAVVTIVSLNHFRTSEPITVGTVIGTVVVVITWARRSNRSCDDPTRRRGTPRRRAASCRRKQRSRTRRLSHAPSFRLPLHPPING